MLLGRHIKSVFFALSLLGNLTIFNAGGGTKCTHIRIVMVVSIIFDKPHTIQVWGMWFIPARLCQSLLIDKLFDLTLFLCLYL